jgi:hypothetical protein
MKPPRAVVALLIGASAIGGQGCAAAKTSLGASSMPAMPAIVETGAHANVPAACATEAVATRVAAYATQLSAGRPAAAAVQFASAPRFQWYSVSAGPGSHDLLRDRTKLQAYFASRVHHAERLEISQVAVAYFASKGEADFMLMGTRRASDLPRRSPTSVLAKGAITCSDGKITVLSLGSDDAKTDLCPQATQAPVGAVIACTAHR